MGYFNDEQYGQYIALSMVAMKKRKRKFFFCCMGDALSLKRITLKDNVFHPEYAYKKDQ